MLDSKETLKKRKIWFIIRKRRKKWKNRIEIDREEFIKMESEKNGWKTDRGNIDRFDYCKL